MFANVVSPRIWFKLEVLRRATFPSHHRIRSGCADVMPASVFFIATKVIKRLSSENAGSCV